MSDIDVGTDRMRDPMEREEWRDRAIMEGDDDGKVGEIGKDWINPTVRVERRLELEVDQVWRIVHGGDRKGRISWVDPLDPDSLMGQRKLKPIRVIVDAARGPVGRDHEDRGVRKWGH